MSDSAQATGGASAQTRAWILGRLREGLADPSAAFKVPGSGEPLPGPPTPLTHAGGDYRALAEGFGASLDAVLGSHEIVEGADAVGDRVLARIAALREAGSADGLSFARALAWAPDALGVQDLTERLGRVGISVIVPDDLHDPRQRRDAAGAAVGVTAVDAALASTGTLVLGAGPGRSRVASLFAVTSHRLGPHKPNPRQRGRVDRVSQGRRTVGRDPARRFSAHLDHGTQQVGGHRADPDPGGSRPPNGSRHHLPRSEPDRNSPLPRTARSHRGVRRPTLRPQASLVARV